MDSMFLPEEVDAIADPDAATTVFAAACRDHIQNVVRHVAATSAPLPAAAASAAAAFLASLLLKLLLLVDAAFVDYSTVSSCSCSSRRASCLPYSIAKHCFSHRHRYLLPLFLCCCLRHVTTVTLLLLPLLPTAFPVLLRQTARPHPFHPLPLRLLANPLHTTHSYSFLIRRPITVIAW